MIVRITKKHCINIDGSRVDYTNIYDCPLYRAIKEQYPEFPLQDVVVGRITDLKNNTHFFELDRWNYGVFLKLEKDEIAPVVLNIPINEKEHTH